MATNVELLSLVEAALAARMSGRAVQEYRIGGLNVKYAELSDLIGLRERLRNEIAREGGTTVAAIAVDPKTGAGTT